MIKATIFDLDGVIVDTAKYHYLAWRKLANSLGFDFSKADNEQLKGVSRMESLELILKIGGQTLGETRKQELAKQKNDWYLEHLDKMTDDEILPGVVDFLDDVAAQSIKIALGSASKNAELTLKKVGLLERFEVVIDGTKTTRSKPDPQVFLLGAAGLGVEPAHCVVFEDAAKGIDAALSAGMYAIGMGNETELGHAHLVLPSLEGVRCTALQKQLVR